MRFTALNMVHRYADMISIPKTVVEEASSQMMEFRGKQYFIIEGSDNEQFPNGIYAIQQVTQYHIHCYKIAEGILFKKEEYNEDLQELQGGNQRDTKRPGGNGHTGKAKELPKQNNRR